MNISAYMNGKHYIPNESAKDLVARQEGFSEYEAAISDETPFTTFMKDAKVAYDYNGQRLIFISPANVGFQYVYKIDTQTWHKVAFSGFDLTVPLNSYPQCLVQSDKTEIIKAFWIYSPMEGEPDEMIVSETKSFFLMEAGLEISDGETISYLKGENYVDLSSVSDEAIENVNASLRGSGFDGEIRIQEHSVSKVYDLGTVLDPFMEQNTAKGILITRPFDLGMPDVFKSITDIKVRGYYDKKNIKFILQGSDNGKDFYTMNSFRGKSWKMFRLFILADLEPTERISWIDIDFEPRYNNRLR